MRYGIGYKGSKNNIARGIIDFLPPAEILVDLFAGGCAVTHCALLSHKYGKVVANDVTAAPELFEALITGKYSPPPDWISRERFFAEKDADIFIRLIWSFGYGGKAYIYGKDVAEYKRAYHLAVVNADYAPFEKLGVNLPGDFRRFLETKSLDERRMQVRFWIAQHRKELAEKLGVKNRLPDLETLERCAALERLCTLPHPPAPGFLETSRKDYRRVVIPKGAVVYCDPPYSGTDCGMYGGFDSAAFWNWARSHARNLYISEYKAPDDFIQVKAFKHVVRSSNKGTGHAVEKIFVHKSFYPDMIKTELFC